MSPVLPGSEYLFYVSRSNSANVGYLSLMDNPDESVNMPVPFVENRVKIRGNLRNLREFEMREHFF